MGRNQIHSRLKSLVRKFEANKYHYLSKKYLEEEVKIDFINPLFEALGWDIRNTKGLSPYERDVVVEKGETLGRPDYNFRIDGQTKFYVEAKAPHEPLHKINHVLQAKSYAWNTKNVFIVLLTDFEEFRLFDATIKPDPKNPDQGLIFELTYDKYLENLDKLMLLSKEEVEKGSLDKLLLKDRESKRLRIPVDKAFLEDLSKWREELAKDIYKRNIKELEDRSDEKRVKIQVKILNEAVQKILDRLIFIRIAEDRKIIEPKSLLDEVEWWKAGGKRRDLHIRLKDRFIGWNQDFNGEILKTGPCDVLDIDSHLLAKIIDGLYFPKCPYRFDVIGVELLGSIYERYLGKTIRVTPKRVKIEEKPEVRKAGGVYYTPQYIVDYIVKNTVGKIIKGKTPKQIKKIKILDPACGSGSFLLTAFRILIDYHLDYYEKHPEETSQGTLFPDVIVDYEGNKRLSIEKKAQILKNSIFGVDIDPQAVEIAMMSLYLKCLDGEKDLPQKKELLPSLAKNIRCGNSLISYDIFDQLTLFDDEEKEQINPFDWNSRSTGFGEIMEKGGFDVVIGNPPYINAKTLVELFEMQRKYLDSSNKHETLYQKWDIYIAFMEKGLKLLRKEGGLFSMIIPFPYINQMYAKKSREFICNNYTMLSITDLSKWKIFQDAHVKNCIIVVKKRKPKNNQIDVIKMDKENNFYLHSKLPQNILMQKNTSVWDIEESKKLTFFDKKFINLGDCCFVSKGMVLNADEFKAKGKFKKKDLISNAPSSIYIKKYVEGKDIDRYIILRHRYLEWGTERVPKLISRPTFPELYECPKILVNKLGSIKAALDHERFYCEQTIRVVVLFKYLHNVENKSITNSLKRYYRLERKKLEAHSEKINYSFLLGLLNSKLAIYLLNQIRGRKNIDINPEYLKQLPIPTIDFNNPEEKAMHDKIVKLVDKMLELNKKKSALLPGSKREKIEREIKITDEKIDELVYELYGITEEERKIIEKES